MSAAVWVKADGEPEFIVRLVENKLDLKFLSTRLGLRLESLMAGDFALDSDASGRSIDIEMIKELDGMANCGDGSKQHPFIIRGEAAIASELPDLSKAWAEEVVTPFPYPVLEPDDLRAALNEDLPLKLPIDPICFRQLEPAVAAHFFPTLKHPHIASLVQAFMFQGRQSESFQWDVAFSILWGKVASLLNLTSVTFNRNVTDPSGASTTDTRPDLMLWAIWRLIVEFEEKRQSLAEAYEYLIRKIAFLPAIYFGPVKWIIGVGLANGQMCVWGLQQGRTPAPLSDIFDMGYPAHRYECLKHSFNFLRIALTLAKRVFNTLVTTPRPYYRLPISKYGEGGTVRRDLVVLTPLVFKFICPWSSHVKQGFTTLEYVRQAYAIRVPQLIEGEVTLRDDDVYKVILNPVGYEEVVMGEETLREVVVAVLYALVALHKAGLVHRDIRWKNILKKVSGGWMLVDLETVWKSGEKPNCWLQAWDERTLDKGLYFTEQSDLYLLGKLMLSSSNLELSREAWNFLSRLCNREYESALQALDAYLLNE